MQTFFLSFLLLAVIIFGMATGVIFMGRRIKGSCGGISGEECPICHKEVK